MKNNIKDNIRSSLSMLLVLTILLGVVYPAFITLVAKILFNDSTNGSLIEKDGKVIGSYLLAQEFTENKYFWSRPSATTPPYNTLSSAASNLSPANMKLIGKINERVKTLKEADPMNKALIPVDLVTASASGLDPNISLQAAEYQIGRIAKARGKQPDEIQKIIMDSVSTQSKIFGIPYVNVLELNLKLDETGK
ncbi:MAG: potassium-transporting ATPase subunit KdpC [Rickettsiales bacterium]